MSESESDSPENGSQQNNSSDSEKSAQQIKLIVPASAIQAQLAPGEKIELKLNGSNFKSGKDDKEEDGKEKGGDNKEGGDEEDKKDEKKKPPLYKKPAFIITMIIVVLVLIIGVIIIWLIERQYVRTDDAYIDGHVIQVAPQVAAPVQILHIQDNEFVRRGDLLLELDPTDYIVALDQAKAQVSQARGQLAQAQAQVISAEANVPMAEAQVRAAQASLDNATKDLRRYQDVDARARTKQQLDTSGASQTNAQSQLEEAKAQLASARANVGTAQASVGAAEGQVEAALAGQKRAEVNLGYCKIYAPHDGRVTERTVEAGNYVMPGQALFMLVDPDVWVTANFKETQLTLMKPGQPVVFKVDAFPGKKFQGHVDSIQAGSGSRFSILPAENATGNYIKIVQRVPVKILFDHGPNTNNAEMLSPGQSVTPRVKVR